MAELREYGAHADMVPMVRKAFAQHVMKKGPGYSWLLRTPGSSCYWFRVTWTPGAVVVTGDIGETVYRIWPSFGSLWGAVELIAQANCDYLASKTGADKVFDPDASVVAILKAADEQLKWGGSSLWDGLVKEYVNFCDYDESSARRKHLKNPRSGAVQMQAAKALREDGDITAGRLWNMLDDPPLVYEYKPEVRWHYEAVRLWARKMLAAEPRWHRAKRRLGEQWRRLRSDVRMGVLWQPVLYQPADGGTFNGSKLWVRHRWTSGKESFRSVSPFRPFGVNLSGLGLYVMSGSSWSIDDGRDEARFALVSPPDTRAPAC